MRTESKIKMKSHSKTWLSTMKTLVSWIDEILWVYEVFFKEKLSKIISYIVHLLWIIHTIDYL